MADFLCTNNDIDQILIKADPILKGIINSCGTIKINLSLNYYEALVSAIVGQQLSNKVAEVIWQRLIVLLNNKVEAVRLLAVSDADLRAIGISHAKIGYIKNLSKAIIEGQLYLDGLVDKDDDDVIKCLTAIKGIGNWTAEMFLIFSLGRSDVFSAGDGGLRRAMVCLYGLEEPLNKTVIAEITNYWKPYRTYASLYLWEAINTGLIN